MSKQRDSSASITAPFQLLGFLHQLQHFQKSEHSHLIHHWSLKYFQPVTSTALFIEGRNNTANSMVSSACNSNYNSNTHLDSAHCSYSLNHHTHNDCLAVPSIQTLRRCSGPTNSILFARRLWKDINIYNEISNVLYMKGDEVMIKSTWCSVLYDID